ncbi:MAG: trypsin-like peptidase domain-containing protein [bacterium]
MTPNEAIEQPLNIVNNQSAPIDQPIIQPQAKIVNHKPRKKKKLAIFSTFVILLLISSLLITFFWLNGGWKNLICKFSTQDSFFYEKVNCSTTASTNTNLDQGKTVPTIDKSKFGSQEELITTIVNNSLKSVVTVAASTALDPTDFENGIQSSGNQNIGSGFIVREDGIIITNSHVVGDTTLDYSIIMNGEKNPIPAKNIYRDTSSDIAIIVIDKKALPALKLGDSDSIKIGSTTIAIGSPLGDLTGSVTSGIVSGLNRDVTAGSSSGSSQERIQGVIQTDAAVNPGNSGGPLLNSNGEVIGINFATTQGAENISFAIPINRVKTKLEEFNKNGRLLQPYIGIAFTQRTYYLKDGVMTGALISQVQTGSPADKAGLKKGDLVLKINDKSMETESLQNIIQTSKVGDELSLNVWRSGTKLDLKVVVGDKSGN